MDTLTLFYEWAIKNNWKVSKTINNIDLEKHKILKHFDIDRESLYYKFIVSFSLFESDDSKKWFLCVADYHNSYSDCEFAWNEFERISLNSAITKRSKTLIKQWWGWHLPIAISVKDGYRFWAIDLKEKKGSVVCGYEPEFEDVEIVAEDFEQFLLYVMKNNI